MVERIFSGKYEVQEEIARGGMGVLYRALDRKLNRQVAIKLLHAQFSGDPTFSERFLREARHMARLDHENIIRIHAVEEEQGSLYLVMEYFPGKDLRHFIRSPERMSLRQTVTTCLQVINALAYAHEQGIIHRDIKPGNIMLDKHGKTKLGDFGIAAAMDEASITSTGSIIGTPEYMSPEQARGRRLDGRSDLYSLGMVLYEMLVGHTPYRDLPQTALLAQLISERDEIEFEFPLKVPSELQEIVRTLLQRQPEQRPPDATILAEQLRRVLDTLPQTEEAKTTARMESPTMTRKMDIPAPTGPPGPVPQAESTRDPLTVAKTDVLPPPKPVRPSPLARPPTAPLKTYNFMPLAVGAVMILTLLGGLAYYLKFIPVDGPRGEESANALGAGPVSPELSASGNGGGGPDRPVGLVATHKAQDTAEQERREAARKTAERDRRLAAEQAALEAKRQRRAEEEAQRERARQRQLVAAQQAREKAERQRREAARKTAERDRRLAAEQAALEAKRQRRAEEEAQREKEKKLQVASIQDPELDTDQVSTDLRRQRLDELLATFKTAYESRDMRTLQEITTMSSGRPAFLQMMFHNYASIKVSIDVSSMTDQEANAVILHTELIDAKGNPVTPSPILRQVKVQIPREGTQWGKIVW